MPTYTYECTACNHKFDEFNYISSSDETKCPECGGVSKKAWGCSGGSTMLIKGSGFYQERTMR